jgi:cardiolipin synthase A/B
MHRKERHKVAAEHNNTPVESIELVHSGEDYFFRVLQLISKAQSEIHLQTYIFANDATGLEITRALIEAANRNVKVYVLLDGYGSSNLPNYFFEELLQAGIHIRLFSPWYANNIIYIGRRLHHKVIVADGKVALIGGINIADKYRGSNAKLPWLDYAVQIESIAIAEPLQQLCRDFYVKNSRSNRKPIQTDFNEEQKTSVKILLNDWVKQSADISKAYITALRKADRELIIVASYFLPGRNLSSAMRNAAKRGVQVKIILSGVSDLPFIMRATQYLYASLLEQGIQLFEWKKSVLHGKLMVADTQWATIGSFNLNHLSSYGNIEMNVVIDSSEFCEKLRYHLLEVIDQSEPITFETLSIRNSIWLRFTNWLAYRLIRIALIILTYFPYKRFFK